MIVELHDEAGIAVLKPAGRLDTRTAGAFRQRLRGLIEDGICCIVVDMGQVEFVDSAGLAALVSALKLARTQSGDVRLAALQDPVRLIFEITRLHRTFDIYEDRAEAVEAFARMAAKTEEMEASAARA